MLQFSFATLHLCLGENTLQGGPLWALSQHVCNVYFNKMCYILFWVSPLAFGLDILIFTKLMISNII